MYVDFDSIDVYAFYGPNFDLVDICLNGSELICGIATGASEAAPDYEKNPMGLTLVAHTDQIYAENRLQSFSSDYPTRRQTDEYELDGIDTIPISLISSSNDEICPPA